MIGTYNVAITHGFFLGGGGGGGKIFLYNFFWQISPNLAKQVEFTLEKPDLILESSYFCQKT
jgi:hypothetical protein